MHAFYQPRLSCGRASNPPARWFIHPHRKRWGIKNLFRKKAKEESKQFFARSASELLPFALLAFRARRCYFSASETYELSDDHTRRIRRAPEARRGVASG